MKNTKKTVKSYQSEEYEATFGGAETNVALAVANYGMDVALKNKNSALYFTNGEV